MGSTRGILSGRVPQSYLSWKGSTDVTFTFDKLLLSGAQNYV